MRAFLVDSISGNAEDGFKFYNSALEVLKWGAERWKDVPDSRKALSSSRGSHAASRVYVLIRTWG